MKIIKIILELGTEKWYYIETYFVGICLEKYPSWPKGLPWKGSRSGEPARGFKSLFLRSWSGVMQLINEPSQSNIWQLNRNATLNIFLKKIRTNRLRMIFRIFSERTKPSKLRSRIDVNVYLWQYWTWISEIREAELLRLYCKWADDPRSAKRSS